MRRSLPAIALLLSACASAPVHKNVEHYALKGVVVRVNPAEKIAVIKHEKIQNQAGKVWMEPMTMDFPVPNASELQKLQVGKTIEGRLNQDTDSLDYWVDQIR